MIETTYITIGNAARMLDTDESTLLIAAVEGRLRIYGFLGRGYQAIYWVPIIPTPEGFDTAMRGKGDDYKWFDFAPLSRANAAELLSGKETTVEELSEPNPEDGGRWCPDIGLDEDREIAAEIESSLVIGRQQLYVKRADVEAIKSNKGASIENAIPPQKPMKKSAVTRRNDTLLIIIAALAKQAKIQLDDREAASRIEGCVTRLGLSISSGTTTGVIKEVLEQIPESLQRRRRE